MFRMTRHTSGMRDDDRDQWSGDTYAEMPGR